MIELFFFKKNVISIFIYNFFCLQFKLAEMDRDHKREHVEKQTKHTFHKQDFVQNKNNNWVEQKNWINFN